MKDETIYDYYYSENHNNHVREINMYLMPNEEIKPDTFINGIKYTEMIKAGKEPMTNHFGDLKKVFTGNSDGITYGYSQK